MLSCSSSINADASSAGWSYQTPNKLSEHELSSFVFSGSLSIVSKILSAFEVSRRIGCDGTTERLSPTPDTTRLPYICKMRRTRNGCEKNPRACTRGQHSRCRYTTHDTVQGTQQASKQTNKWSGAYGGRGVIFRPDQLAPREASTPERYPTTA